MHILVAPNAFKNSCSAMEAAKSIAEGLKRSSLECNITCFPIGDGGDGTAELLVSTLNGRYVRVEVNDPLGRKIDSVFGLVDDGKTAIIGMSDASGIKLLKPEELDPLVATSFGTGELIKHALDQRVERIILCVGGSATVDGGIGILTALGVKGKNKDGVPVDMLPLNLSEVEQLDPSGIDSRIKNTNLVVLCDVDNKLLGKQGAAAVFGPQKGADEEAVFILEKSLTHLRNLLLKETGIDTSGIKYGGAAGGVSSGLHAVLKAELVNGIEYFLQITGFTKALDEADLVITGEGSIDLQTLQGKGPFGVAVKAKEKGKPVIGLSGSLPAIIDEALFKYFNSLLSISNQPQALPDALVQTIPNLTRIGTEIGNLLSLGRRI